MKSYGKGCEKAWPNKFLLVSSICFNSETCLTTISTTNSTTTKTTTNYWNTKLSYFQIAKWNGNINLKVNAHTISTI